MNKYFCSEHFLSLKIKGVVVEEVHRRSSDAKREKASKWTSSERQPERNGPVH